MSQKKKDIVGICSFCHNEDIVDTYTKLCKICQGKEIELEEDDDEDDGDW